MRKRTQLNIEIDEGLLRSLKYLALKKNIKLNALVKQILSEKTELENLSGLPDGYSDKDAINFHNFMKSLFEKKAHKSEYKSMKEAFDSLIPFIEKHNKWKSSDTKRLKLILLESDGHLQPNELDKLCGHDEYGGPIYDGLKNWTGTSEFPSKKLICDLGSSLVPILENNIKISKR